jgi:hypothetical protein
MAARTFFGPGNFGRRIVEHGNGAFGWRDVFHGRHRRLFASGRNAPRRDVLHRTAPPIPRSGVAIGPRVLNDPFFSGGLSMGNPKIAIVAYCIAIGFILAVAFHSSSKTLIADSVPAVTPVANWK